MHKITYIYTLSNMHMDIMNTCKTFVSQSVFTQDTKLFI